MDWDATIAIVGDNLLLLPTVLTSNVLAIDIQAENYRPTWFKSGYLKSFIDIDGELIEGNSKILTFGKQLIDFPYSSYRLQFEPVGWLVNATLSYKQLSSTTINQIMPLYSPLPSSFGEQPVTDSTPTTFPAPGYLVATPAANYQCLPPNPSRQRFAVANFGTVPVYLDLDAPTTATKRFVTIPANSTYSSDFVYQGAVFIWSSNATAQSCEIREFIQ